MRSRELQLGRYDTDKVRNGYLQWYDELVGARCESVRRVLELGVHRGGSLALWRDYFPNATIAGIDVDLAHFHCDDLTRIEVFQGLQTDEEFLRRTASAVAPEGFDLVIDDASHIGWETELAFRVLFEHVKRGGFYVIEDWGTGYLPEWPDGRRAKTYGRGTSLAHRLARRFGFHLRHRSHEHGLVGFIKQLVDEQGALEFASMTITPGLVAVRKK